MLILRTFTQKTLYFMILMFLLLLISCGRTPEPKAPPVQESDRPLFKTQDLRQAKIAKHAGKTFIRRSERNLSAIEKELPSELFEPEGDLTPQTVIASVDGWVVYIRSNGTTYQIYRHDQTNDARLLVYSGSDEIQSVAISSDGDHILATIYDAVNANFEVYELVISSSSVTNLSNTTAVNENNVSISAAGDLIVWEGEDAGQRAPVMCFYTSGVCTTSVLSSTNNQVQPSISSNGEYLMLIEELSSGSDRIKMYVLDTETYIIVATSSLPLEHPSVSDSGVKVMYLQHDTTAGIDRIKIKDLSTGVTTTERSATMPSFLDHPHITADGLYLTYGVESSTGKLLAKTRDIASNLEGSTSNASYDHFGTFWQKPISSYSRIYVDKDATGNHSGRDWNNAFTKLQDALNCARIDACPGTNQIWVASGAHYPDEGVFQIANDEAATFELINGIYLAGGFDGVGAGGTGGAQETEAAQRNFETSITILSGDIYQDDLNTDGNSIAETTADIVGDNSDLVVETSSGAGTTTVVDGFTISAGQSRENDPSSDTDGAGMFSYGGTITNTNFSGNYSDGRGGGLFVLYSSPILSNVMFQGNTANHGGGIFHHGNFPVLTDVFFIANSARSGGGAFYNFIGTPILNRVYFHANSAEFGGAIANIGYNITLTNAMFTGNAATLDGGAIYNYVPNNNTFANIVFSGNTASQGGAIYNNQNSGDYSSQLTLLNTTFSQNTASVNGGSIYNRRSVSSDPLTLNIKNTILWNNQAAGLDNEIYNDGGTVNIRYSDTKGGWNGTGVVNLNGGTTTSGGGNLRTNPRFMDADGPDNIVGTLDDNLRLSYSGTVSPLIDKGTNNGVAMATDLQGNPRVIDGDGNGTATVDMGAYEKQ